MDRDAARLELLSHVPIIKYADPGLETLWVEVRGAVKHHTLGPAHAKPRHQVQNADARGA
jgi:hypothetical protein